MGCERHNEATTVTTLEGHTFSTPCGRCEAESDADVAPTPGRFGRLPDGRWGVWAPAGLPAGTTVVCERKDGKLANVALGLPVRTHAIYGALYLRAGMTMEVVLADLALSAPVERDLALARRGCRSSGPLPVDCPAGGPTDPEGYGASLADDVAAGDRAEGIRAARWGLTHRAAQ